MRLMNNGAPNEENDWNAFEILAVPTLDDRGGILLQRLY